MFIFSAMSVTCACLFFLIKSGFKITVSGEIVPYAILFAVGYSMAVVFNFLAISAGSLSLSSLAMSYSLLIPTAYGLIFDNDKASLFFYLGILLLVVSLFLINSKKGDNEITLKWAVFAVLSLIGNGACSTVLTVQSVHFDGKYDSGFMVIALSIVAAVLFTVAFFKEKVITTWLIAAFVYKEKLMKTQNIGMLLGVASIVLLNLN